jgi:hypothetical protein
MTMEENLFVILGAFLIGLPAFVASSAIFLKRKPKKTNSSLLYL